MSNEFKHSSVGTQLSQAEWEDVAAHTVNNAVQGRILKVSSTGSIVQDVGSLTNLLTNPGFEIWQRGAGPFTADGALTADRWFISLVAPSTVSISRIASTIGTQNYSAQIAYTHAAGGAISYQDRIENYTAFRGKTVTFAVKVKSNVAGTVYVRLSDGVTATDSANNVGTGVETLTVTKLLDSNATILYAVIRADVASCTFEVDDAVLVVGSIAPEYVPLHPAEEMERCQRYYELIGGGNDGGVMFGGYCAASGTFEQVVQFRTTKAVIPTTTINGTWSLTNTTLQPTLPVGSSVFNTTVRVTNSSGSAQYCAARNVGSYANITVEANP